MSHNLHEFGNHHWMEQSKEVIFIETSECRPLTGVHIGDVDGIAVVYIADIAML